MELFSQLNAVFPNLMVRLLFYQIQEAPGPNVRKTGKSLTKTKENSEDPDQLASWKPADLDLHGF